MSSKRDKPPKKGKKKHGRRPVNLTLDPAIRKAAEALSESLGVRFVRLVDFALREELARHGVALEPTPADGALEALIRSNRTHEAG
ncbi:MAG TPA: hypothetical protein VGM56_15910 [Byssovorax sp.]|jgi:hypothetical protein